MRTLTDKQRKMLYQSLKTLLLVLVTLISVLPFYFLIVMSTYTTEEIYRGLTFQFGSSFLRNFQLVMTQDFFNALKNSLLVSLSSVVVSVLFSSMAGYALTVYRFKLKKALYMFILITMMVPGQISMVGYLQEMRSVGLANSLIPLILPWCGYGFGAFWMTQSMEKEIQLELIESARIDGSGELRTFFTIVIPTLLPALCTLSIMVFLWSWNSYMLPLIMVTRSANYTIPIFITTLGNAFKMDYAARMTGLLWATIPLIMIFALGSKYFIRGLTAGAIKG